MKKCFSLLIVLAMLVAFAMPVLVSCNKDKAVTSVKVLNAQTEFTLGEKNVIDYDNLELEVTFDDGSKEVKTVKQWGATYTTVDLSKVGTWTYSVTYGNKSDIVTVTVKVPDGGGSTATVKVTYKYNNGDADSEVTITKGGKASLPRPTYANHKFDGWFTKDGTTSGDWGTAWNEDDPVEQDLVLYARWTKNVVTYTVTFDDGGKTTQQTVEEGGNVTFPQVSKERFTLDGWYTKNGAETDEWGEKWLETDEVTGNLTLYAKWKANQYSNVVFHHLDKQPETTSTQEVLQGSTLTLPTVEREGYTLLGWYTQNGTTTGNWGEKWAEDKAAQETQFELFAKWQKNNVTVTFDFNFPGGVDGEPTAETVTLNVVGGDKLSEHLASADGKAPAHFDFVGWYTNPTSGVVASDTIELLDDVTLYAHWSQRKVSVTFKFANAEPATADKTVEINEGAAVGTDWPADPVRTGYRFDGWADEKGTKYTNAQAINQDVTLTAQWVQQVTVKFNLNYQTDKTVGNVVLDVNTAMGSKFPAAPAREATPATTYTFDGWYATAECTGDKYTESTVITQDVELFAKWAENEVSHTVTFEIKEGEGQLPEGQQKQVTVVYDHTVTVPEATRNGYRFDGWWTQDGTEGWGTQFTSETHVTADITVYAKWTKQVAVYLHQGYDESPDLKPTYVDPEGTLQLEKNMLRTGYTFLGWFDEQAGGKQYSDFTVTVGADASEDVHVYAQWKPVTVKVTLDALRKGEVEVITVEYGSDLDLDSHVPNVTDATFEGWFRNNGNLEGVEWGEQVTKLTAITEDTTLYAKWNENITVYLVFGNGKDVIGASVPAGSSIITKVVYDGMLQGFYDGIVNNPMIANMDEAQKIQKAQEIVALTQQIVPWTESKVGYYPGNIGTAFNSAITNHIFGLGTASFENLLKKIVTIYDGELTRPGYTFGINYFGIITSYWDHFISGVQAPWPIADTNLSQDYILKQTLWLYAAWTPTGAEPSCSVTFHYNDGTDNTYATEVYDGSTLALPGPARDGYEFQGWYTTKDNAQPNAEEDYLAKWDESQTVTGETHLWAKWQKVNESYVVTLNNGTETKSFTVEGGKSLNAAAEENPELKEFLATAENWLDVTGSVSKPFDLSSPVDGNLNLMAQSGDQLSGYVLSFSAPDFYLNYKQRSTTEGDSLGYFKQLNNPYEVGTVNKFIFRPVVRLRTEDSQTVIDYNPRTTYKVEFADKADGTFAPHDEWVTVENNTYKFSDDAAGKYVRLSVSLQPGTEDAGYFIPGSVKNEVTAEFVLVKGGYNVYDQRGLSVMNDNQQKVWSSLWGVEAEIVGDDSLVNRGDAYKYKVIFKDPATHQELAADNTTVGVKLAADDMPLYRYVGNVDWVILHNDIELDPTQMPQEFFWQAGDPLYYAAYQSLAGWQNQQEKLVGSLKDGDNSGVQSSDNYAIMMDTSDGWNAINLGISLNMQKGFYSTSRVSVSGNYFSLTHILERGGRKLQNYVDWQESTKVSDPVTHWSVFQLMTSRNGANEDEDVTQRSGYPDNPFTLKNIAMKGSTPQKDYYDKGKTIYFAPAGIMLANTYSSINIQNLNANNFFTTIVGDNYGDSDDFHTNYNVVSSKFYDTYSNMVYTWRGHITIDTCEMVGSGGPLFILCDDNRNDPACANEEGGPELEVKGTCRLEAYATGAESWYDANNAAALVTTLRSAVETNAFNSLDKTLRWVKDNNATESYGMRPFNKDDVNAGKNEYINVIAVMICSPGNLLSGAEDGDNRFTPAVKGKSMFNSNINGCAATASVEFAMHSAVVLAVKRAAAGISDPTQFPTDSSKWPILVQMGSNYFASDLNEVKVALDPLFASCGVGGSEAFKAAKATENGNLACIYLSAAAITGNGNAPYFGAILSIGDYQ